MFWNESAILFNASKWWYNARVLAHKIIAKGKQIDIKWTPLTFQLEYVHAETVCFVLDSNNSFDLITTLHIDKT